MGIQNLHQQLKSIAKEKRIEEYKGKRIGVDMFVWLHNSISSCAELLAHNRPTDAYVKFVEKCMRCMMHAGVTPVAVFDGDALPAKAGENESRREKREANRKKALAAEQNGDMNMARQYWVSALSVSDEMVKNTIARLKKMNIEVIVAPYEADAQLAYMQRTGYVDVCCSVDGDLLAFGCTCLLTKFDIKTGTGKEICVPKDFQKVQGLNFKGWTDDMFKVWCVTLGCDYLTNVRKCGPKKALKKILANKIFVYLVRCEILEKILYIDPTTSKFRPKS